jgi:hypothetical protein
VRLAVSYSDFVLCWNCCSVDQVTKFASVWRATVHDAEGAVQTIAFFKQAFESLPDAFVAGSVWLLRIYKGAFLKPFVADPKYAQYCAPGGVTITLGMAMARSGSGSPATFSLALIPNTSVHAVKPLAPHQAVLNVQDLVEGVMKQDPAFAGRLFDVIGIVMEVKGRLEPTAAGTTAGRTITELKLRGMKGALTVRSVSVARFLTVLIRLMCLRADHVVELRVCGFH